MTTVLVSAVMMLIGTVGGIVIGAHLTATGLLFGRQLRPAPAAAAPPALPTGAPTSAVAVATVLADPVALRLVLRELHDVHDISSTTFDRFDAFAARAARRELEG